MRKDVGLGVLFGVAIVTAAGVYFFSGGRDGGDLVALESTTAPPRSTVQHAEPPAHAEPKAPVEAQPAAAVAARSAEPTSDERAALPIVTKPTNPPADSPGAVEGAALPTAAAQTPPPVEPRIPPPVPSRPAQASVPPPSGEPALPLIHIVERGDSLSQISKRYYHDARHGDWILKANPELKDAHQLQIGTKLVIPRPAAAATPAETKPKPHAASSAPASGPARYTVKAGDTLTAIAARTLGSGRRWKEIYQLNHALIGPHPEDLRVGMVLKLPPSSAPASRPAKAAKPHKGK